MLMWRGRSIFGAVVRLGRSETVSGGRRKLALLGDAIEAVIAAVYLDAGFQAARDMVLRLWADRITQVDDDARDAKNIPAGVGASTKSVTA